MDSDASLLTEGEVRRPPARYPPPRRRSLYVTASSETGSPSLCLHVIPAKTLIAHVRDEQARGDLRDDLPAEKIAGFVSLVADGIAVQMGSGEPIPDVETLVAFVRSAVGPPLTT